MNVSRFKVYPPFHGSVEASVYGSSIPSGARWEFFVNMPGLGRALVFVDTACPPFLRGRRGVGASVAVYHPGAPTPTGPFPGPEEDARPFGRYGVEVRAGFRSRGGVIPLRWEWRSQERAP